MPETKRTKVFGITVVNVDGWKECAALTREAVAGGVGVLGVASRIVHCEFDSPLSRKFRTTCECGEVFESCRKASCDDGRMEFCGEYCSVRKEQEARIERLSLHHVFKTVVLVGMLHQPDSTPLEWASALSKLHRADIAREMIGGYLGVPVGGELQQLRSKS